MMGWIGIVWTGVSVWGMEFGGFDVEVGVGAYPEEESWGQEWNSGAVPERPQEEIPQSPLPDLPQDSFPQNQPSEDFQNPPQDWQWQEESPGQQWGEFQPPEQNFSDWNDNNGNQADPPVVPGINGQNGGFGYDSSGNTGIGLQTNPGADAAAGTGQPSASEPASVPVPTVTPQPTATPAPVPSPTPTPVPTSTLTPELPYVYYRKQLPPQPQVKDEEVEFLCTLAEASGYPEITVRSEGSVQILSFRINGTEVPWHWENDRMILETEREDAENWKENPEIEILFLPQGGSTRRRFAKKMV